MFFWLTFYLGMIATASTVTLSRERFIDQFTLGASKVFCEKDSYFRKCFSITEEECKRRAEQEVRNCLNALSSGMPAQLVQPGDGRLWGEKVGACAGAQFELVLQRKRQNTEACNNPDLWAKEKK